MIIPPTNHPHKWPHVTGATPVPCNWRTTFWLNGAGNWAPSKESLSDKLEPVWPRPRGGGHFQRCPDHLFSYARQSVPRGERARRHRNGHRHGGPGRRIARSRGSGLCDPRGNTRTRGTTGQDGICRRPHSRRNARSIDSPVGRRREVPKLRHERGPPHGPSSRLRRVVGHVTGSYPMFSPYTKSGGSKGAMAARSPA